MVIPDIQGRKILANPDLVSIIEKENDVIASYVGFGRQAYRVFFSGLSSPKGPWFMTTFASQVMQIRGFWVPGLLEAWKRQEMTGDSIQTDLFLESLVFEPDPFKGSPSDRSNAPKISAMPPRYPPDTKAEPFEFTWRGLTVNTDVKVFEPIKCNRCTLIKEYIGSKDYGGDIGRVCAECVIKLEE